MPGEADLAQILVGKGLGAVRQKIAFLARIRLPVLILGESGVGKELAARGLALLSGRPLDRFVPVNAATLADPLAESLLFGHARGAFTGAVEAREGFFEAARGGILFLDEIADMSPAVQAKVLRLLEEKSFTRLGETRPIQADTWLLMATNANLFERVSRGRFRADLLHRLLGSILDIPPLRGRAGDIPELVRHFAVQIEREFNLPPITVPESCMNVLRRHPWPGNVRQLRNFVSLAMQEYPGEAISPLQARWAIQRSLGLKTDARSQSPTRQELARLLKAAGGNISEAARLRGVSRQYLHRLLKAASLLPRGRSRTQLMMAQGVAPHL